MKGRVRKWITWVAVTVLLVIFIPVLVLTVNQIKGQGICFSNLKTWLETKRLLNEYMEGDYEEALARIDLESVYKNHKEIKQMSEEYSEYNQTSLQIFLENGKKLKEKGYEVVDFKLGSVKEGTIAKWEFTYQLTVKYQEDTYENYAITLMGENGKYLVKQITRKNEVENTVLASNAEEETFEVLFLSFSK